MISVTRLDGKKYWINPHMIESMENTPDLTITFLSGKKVMVKDSPDELIEKIIDYRNRLEISKQEI
ncbi:flagellar FlbD family protein [Treponema pectinovorum]|uniref:flagellar FlbD family protein n=1 Tax=Treponema pectinovorum TaxID=164 RepID=UPI0011CC74CE|nr:flagellar FlbD family protein [Treponema pectinovorum]